MTDFDRDGLVGVLHFLGSVLAWSFEGKVARRIELALDRLGVDVFGQHVASGELALDVAAVVVGLLFVLAVDHDAVVPSLDGDLFGGEVPGVDVDGELVRSAGDRRTLLGRRLARVRTPAVRRYHVEPLMEERRFEQLTVEQDLAEVVVE
ncbi:hypothetical protein MRX96_029507 [Rhipicephalus microplus]